VLSSFALKLFSTAGCKTAVKAPDELAALGLDCGPRRPKSLVIRAKEDCEGAFTPRTEHYNQAEASTNDRGRDTGYPVPPAQIRACPTKALGSHLGWLTAKRSLGQG